MNIKHLISALAIIGALATNTIIASDRFDFSPGPAAFGDMEFSFDLYGLYGSKNRDDFTSGTGGVGAGVNYYFTRYLGASMETYLDEFDFPNHLDASLLARYPLENIALAPYGIVGFGRQFDDAAQWTSHLGLGAEYRLNAKTGFFIDYRRVFADVSPDFDLVRFGIRVVF